MPPRAPIGNRERIESELSLEARLFLAQQRQLRALPSREWQEEDDLNRLFTLTAILTRAKRAEASGVSWPIALREAAVWCGWDPESVARLLRRRRGPRADVMSARPRPARLYLARVGRENPEEEP